MTNSITVLSISFTKDFKKSYTDLDLLLSNTNWNDIAVANWNEEYPYAPKAKFRLSYSEEALIVQYEVEEEIIKAKYYRHNDNIWEDSCVEFFISFDEKGHYYNFEFNPIGAGLIGYGSPVKADRNRLSIEEVGQVEVFSQIQHTNNGSKWNLIQYIPFNVFKHYEISPDFLKSNEIFANFYKCGDELPRPHFLSWNKIDHPTPNFHLPAYFGKIVFE